MVKMSTTKVVFKPRGGEKRRGGRGKRHRINPNIVRWVINVKRSVFVPKVEAGKVGSAKGRAVGKGIVPFVRYLFNLPPAARIGQETVLQRAAAIGCGELTVLRKRSNGGETA